MSFACIHTHTNLCDGSDDIESCCRAAYRKGLESLGFSAHAPITGKTGFKSTWHLPDEKLSEYLDGVRAAKKRWEGKLPVYLGLELDFISGLIGPADRDYREMGLDYIIGSVHYVIPPRGKPFTVDDSAANVDLGISECFGGDPMGMVELYYEAVYEMIKAGGFDLLGHPDVVRKNNPDSRLFSEADAFYRKKIAPVPVLLAEAGILAEINTGGIIRGKIPDCYPSLDFLKAFRECNIPMVINADAHRAEDVDGYYEKARETMLSAGYTETSLFQGRKDGFPVWKSIAL